MEVTYEQVLNMLLERTASNTKLLRRETLQRRNGMEDLYGIMFSASGDAKSPASFYISLSPDYGYLERFAFKFVIKPYASTVAGAGTVEIDIGETTLSGGEENAKVIEGTSTLDAEGSGITPNPHTHTLSGSLSGVDYGIKKISTDSESWEVWIDGVDVTDYLIEQHDGYWIDGEGVYPTNDLDDEQGDFYDILDVASLMTADGKDTDRERLLRRGFKPVEIRSDKPFAVDAYLYVKYSHVNR